MFGLISVSMQRSGILRQQHVWIKILRKKDLFLVSFGWLKLPTVIQNALFFPVVLFLVTEKWLVFFPAFLKDLWVGIWIRISLFLWAYHLSFTSQVLVVILGHERVEEASCCSKKHFNNKQLLNKFPCMKNEGGQILTRLKCSL